MFTISALNVSPNASTFSILFSRVNTMIDAFSSNVVTVANTANGGSTTGNGFVNGTLSSLIFAAGTLRGGNVQSTTTLNVSSNVAVGNSTANVNINFGTVQVSGNLQLNSTTMSVGNSTVFSTVNATQVTVGTSTLNSSAIGASNAALTTFASVGNSTVNTQVNSTAIKVSGQTVVVANGAEVVAAANILVGARSRVNFISGNAVTFTVTDDAVGNQINVTAAFTASVPSPNPSGSNTQIQYNDSGSFAGSTGLVFDKTTNTVSVGNVYSVGNSTVNTQANSTQVTTTNGLFITRMTVGNSTVNVASNSSVINVGSSVSINTTTFVAGANVLLSIFGWSVGNSTVNTQANSTTLNVGSVGLNASAVLVGANVVANLTTVAVGNSTVSVTANSSALVVSNSTFSAVFDVSGVRVGNSTINVVVNTSMVSINGGNVYSTTARNQNISGGATYTSNNQGIKSTGTFTIDPGVCQLQYIAANGAFTLAAPAADGAVDLLVTNGTGAGAITFSGFTVSPNFGDPYVTTNTYQFMFHIRRINGVSTYIIKALQ